ncbi:hypothetical protein B0A55_02214 [Friedmanniomyces simplex]|uniref:DUF2293 domain-containing protein n=1 Tax=Friedmanniomyces simplex TaxID=329884 RepID=A0A4U0XWP2_9PEZI|nr:hypothetical protein B0A55_02214 [Friedmanniomyces simplex]
MAPLTNGTSRAASARTSRAGSSARDIIKKRDKPYKTEHHRILAKKRKLNLQTTYRQNMPPGYTFLPVGTPDLAERCKEISRMKDVPVNVVNAKPISKNAVDPGHVSHHIARIGYHFRADVVDEAREQLGYVFYRGNFVKEMDLQRQRQQAAQDSAVARAFERQGVPSDRLRQKSQLETPDKVRAAIKELFPKIPDYDLDEIVRHAWQEGSCRVGTNSRLELPRRVQLATIARIRHMYTDYDQLLRAFEWKDARDMVEPGCLQKLIEWRGEHDNQDDDELEEIVRETIVIDDDDDVPAEGVSSAEDTSVIEIDSGSEASVEIIHHDAANQDFGAESADERSRHRIDRFRPRQHQQDLRHAIAKQKIGAARERIRTEIPARYYVPPAREALLTANDGREAGRINVQPNANGQYPTEIIVDGQRMRLVSGSSDLRRADCFYFALGSVAVCSMIRSAYVTQMPPQITQTDPQAQPYFHLPPARNEARDQPYGMPGAMPAAQYRPLVVPARGPHVRDTIDPPVASIERDDLYAPPESRRVLAASSHPATPDNGRGVKRRGEDLYRLTPPVYEQRPSQAQYARVSRPLPPGAEVIDLLSPVRLGRGSRTSPMVLSEELEHDAGRSAYPYNGGAIHTRPLAQPVTYPSRPESPSFGRPAEPPPLSYSADYTGDPRHQLGPRPEPIRFVQMQPTTRPHVDHSRASPNGPAYAAGPLEGYARAPYASIPVAQPAGAAGSYQQPSHYAAQPIHGAPAPVQQAYTGVPTHALPAAGPGYAGYETAPGYAAARNDG